jgi:type II secretory pathway pseudopilin PulG
MRGRTLRSEPRTTDDAGETLVELLVAVAIAGIAVVAVIGGIGTSILISDAHRKQTTSGAYARDYAEAVENYVAAGNYDASASPNYSPSTIGFTAPTGFAASVVSVSCWSDASGFTTCPAGGAVQQVKLQVASSADTRAVETLTIIVRKPCDVGSSCP